MGITLAAFPLSVRREKALNSRYLDGNPQRDPATTAFRRRMGVQKTTAVVWDWGIISQALTVISAYRLIRRRSLSQLESWRQDEEPQSHNVGFGTAGEYRSLRAPEKRSVVPV